MNTTQYQILIKPNRSWFHVDWHGLLHYRDLLFFLVRRDCLAKYKQTVLGPFWFILQPLLMTLVFNIVFYRIAKVSTDGLPPFLFYLCGIMVWNYFANFLNVAKRSTFENANILILLQRRNLISESALNQLLDRLDLLCRKITSFQKSLFR